MLEAEATALRMGLHLACRSHCMCVEAEVDSKVLQQIFMGEKDPPRYVQTLVLDIRNLLKNFIQASVNWVTREGNFLVDSFARFALKHMDMEDHSPNIGIEGMLHDLGENICLWQNMVPRFAEENFRMDLLGYKIVRQ